MLSFWYIGLYDVARYIRPYTRVATGDITLPCVRVSARPLECHAVTMLRYVYELEKFAAGNGVLLCSCSALFRCLEEASIGPRCAQILRRRIRLLSVIPKVLL